MEETALARPRYAHTGKVLFVDLTARTHRVETVDETIYRDYLGGYGLGAWLMWRHFPTGTDPLAPEACFAICSGLLTGLRTPFSGRIQIVGKSPLTGTWADSNSGGSVCSHLRRAGYDALVVTGKASEPLLLVIRDGEIAFEPAGELWGMEIPEAFDALTKKFGSKRDVGVSAIGPAGEKQQRIASVMNDRYHAFGRQGFGAIYGSKNLKAIVVAGSTDLPLAKPAEFKAICKAITDEYKKDLGLVARFFTYMAKPKSWLGWMYRFMTRRGMKLQSPVASMRRLWSQRGTTAAVSLSVENGDAPIKNWRGVGARDFPLGKQGMKLDGKAVDKYITKKLSCGDCPMPCKGIVKVKARNLTDVRRPDYETIVGFGANLLNDDLELVTACHDACNRLGIDAVSSSMTLAWVCEAVEKGDLTAKDLDGIDMRWGNGEGALLLTIKMGTGDGCGAWLGHGVKRAAEHAKKGADYAIHVHGGEPAYHDTRFTSLMGVTYIADPTPGRHTAGSASWNETFGVGLSLPKAADKKDWNVKWKGTEGKGKAQALHSNAHQAMNGLGLCMFTMLTGSLPFADLLDAATGWGLTDDDLMKCGERIQNLRAAFNRREGIVPADFAPHPRMLGEGDGNLQAGPLKGIRVPLPVLKDDYYRSMHWNATSGNLSKARATELGMGEILEGFTE